MVHFTSRKLLLTLRLGEHLHLPLLMGFMDLWFRFGPIEVISQTWS